LMPKTEVYSFVEKDLEPCLTVLGSFEQDWELAFHLTHFKTFSKFIL
jgi:hypothetical protein